MPVSPPFRASLDRSVAGDLNAVRRTPSFGYPGHTPALDIVERFESRVRTEFNALIKSVLNITRRYVATHRMPSADVRRLCSVILSMFDASLRKMEADFFTRLQRLSQLEDDSTVENYTARLRDAATTCTFGETLNNATRERFLAGLEDLDLNDELLSRYSREELAEDMELSALIFKEARHLTASSSGQSHRP